jgi:hypothetical protein
MSATASITFGSFNAATESDGRHVLALGTDRAEGAGLAVADSGNHVPGQGARRARFVAAAKDWRPHRVQCAQRVNLDKYLELIATVDIALDSFPYGGGTTTFDALYMGVPVAYRNRRHAGSRSAASILSGLGLDDWIASSIDGYEQLAIERAGDRDAITHLRSVLRARLQGSGFMAEERFVRDFQTALRGLWHRYCEDRLAGKCRLGQRPSISLRFCTAAPLAPLPRLSRRATSTACRYSSLP